MNNRILKDVSIDFTHQHNGIKMFHLENQLKNIKREADKKEAENIELKK